MVPVSIVGQPAGRAEQPRDVRHQPGAGVPAVLRARPAPQARAPRRGPAARRLGGGRRRHAAHVVAGRPHRRPLGHPVPVLPGAVRRARRRRRRGHVDPGPADRGRAASAVPRGASRWSRTGAASSPGWARGPWSSTSATGSWCATWSTAASRTGCPARSWLVGRHHRRRRHRPGPVPRLGPDRPHPQLRRRPGQQHREAGPVAAPPRDSSAV